jgi:hypothetical protein
MNWSAVGSRADKYTLSESYNGEYTGVLQHQ